MGPEIPKTQPARREDPAASLPPAVVGHRTEVDAGTPKLWDAMGPKFTLNPEPGTGICGIDSQGFELFRFRELCRMAGVGDQESPSRFRSLGFGF